MALDRANRREVKRSGFAVDVARVGRTLLSDAFDVGLILLLPLGLNLPVWVGHSCPTPLTLRLILPLPLRLNLPVWVGHSCPTPLTLRLILLLPLGLKLPVMGRTLLSDAFDFVCS
jgi:hypothetical protein